MPRLCPSAPCEEGAYLIGRVQEDGTVAIIRSPIAIGKTFVEQARQNGAIRKRIFALLHHARRATACSGRAAVALLTELQLRPAGIWTPLYQFVEFELTLCVEL
jgi:hypothetical protein